MNKEDFKIIKTRLELSEALLEQRVDDFKRYQQMYENDHYGDSKTDYKERVVVPLITGLIRTIIPSVFTRTPKWFVSARKEEYLGNVPTIEKIIDYFWNELSMQKIAKLALLDNLVVGYSAIFCGYRFVTKDETKGDVLVDREILEDRPVFEHLNPITDVLIDPMATCLHPYNGRYAIRAIRKTESDVFKRYPNAKVKSDSTIKSEYIDKKDFGKVKFSNDPLPSSNSDDKKSKGADDRIVTLYEYWTPTQRVLFSKEGEDVIVEEKNPYFKEIPIIFSENYERLTSPYPIGEVEMAEPMTMELNKTRTQMINHRKRFNRKYGYDKNMVNDESIASLENPEDGTLVPVDGDPDKAIRPISDAALSQDVYASERSMKADFQFIMANFDYSAGGRQTATEVREISDTTFSRRKEKMQTVEQLSTAMIEKLIKLLQYGWEKKDVLPFTSEDGQTEWIELSPEELKGDFIFKFQQGSTEPLNEDLMMKRALDTYNLLARDDSGDVDQYELKKWVLQTLKIQNIDKILPGKPSPEELIPGGALPLEGQEGLPVGQPMPPVATQLPRRPPVNGAALSPAALQGGEANLANLLRGL